MRTHILSDALVHNIYASGSSEVTLQKKERNATSKTFFFFQAIFLWNFLRKMKIEAFTFDSFDCFRMRFIVISTNNFAFFHDC